MVTAGSRAGSFSPAVRGDTFPGQKQVLWTKFLPVSVALSVSNASGENKGQGDPEHFSISPVG